MPLHHLPLAPDLLQSDVEEHIQDADKLREDEAEHVEEETLAVIKDEQRWLKARLGSQFRADFRFKYRNVHYQANQHE